MTQNQMDYFPRSHSLSKKSTDVISCEMSLEYQSIEILRMKCIFYISVGYESGRFHFHETLDLVIQISNEFQTKSIAVNSVYFPFLFILTFSLTYIILCTCPQMT